MTRVHIRTDDEVYRVDAVWLGPPRATFPWRARYSAYGVGLIVMLAVMFVQRRLGIDLGFFSVAWALLITVAAIIAAEHRASFDALAPSRRKEFVRGIVDAKQPETRARRVAAAVAAVA